MACKITFSETYRCGSILGGLVVLFDVGGLALLLYMDQRAKRDISNAFNASAVRMSGLCEPEIFEEKRKQCRKRSPFD